MAIYHSCNWDGKCNLPLKLALHSENITCKIKKIEILKPAPYILA